MFSILTKIFCLFACFLTSSSLLAQDNPKSIFEEADLLIKQEKLSQAYSLMKQYQNANPNDFNAAWKTAQIAYWNGQVDDAKLFYTIAFSTRQLLKIY